AMIASSFAHGTSPARAIVVTGDAVRVRRLPLATPIRRRPTSNASTRSACVPSLIDAPTASGVARVARKLTDVDAEKPRGGAPALLVRRLEQHLVIGGNAEPCVRGEL